MRQFRRVFSSVIPSDLCGKPLVFAVAFAAMIWASFATFAVAQTAETQRLSALARLVDEGATVRDRWRSVELNIDISQPVPWRVFTLDAPRRLVVDFSELDWTGLDRDAVLYESERFTELRAGLFRPGWSRMVIALAEPLSVEKAWMETRAEDAAATLHLRLVPTDEEGFAKAAKSPDQDAFVATPQDTDTKHSRQDGSRDLVVVLDPGHGGIDPGAERDGVVEAELMLQFARELQEDLRRAGGFQVILTREDDVFVPLEQRVTIARRVGADVFLSLHADALAQGRASGATVYTLSEAATDEASRKLAERHDRGDLLAGVDLSSQDDEVALVLMDLARQETAPRSEDLADALVEGIAVSTGSTHKSPRLKAGFSVLKAPDIPSVLLELGFMSSPGDLKRMQSAEWRARAAAGIRGALQYWAVEDAAQAVRLRQ